MRDTAAIDQPEAGHEGAESWLHAGVPTGVLAVHASRAIWIIALAVALLSAGWLGLVFFVDQVRFIVFDPEAKTGFEVFLAVGQLFGAFVLMVSSVEATLWRLRWVAAGIAVFGIGALGYGYVYSSLVASPMLNVMMYGSLYARTLGTTLCAVGLLLPMVPHLDRRALLALALTAVVIGTLVIPLSDDLPALIRIAGTSDIIDHDPEMDMARPIDHLHLADLETIMSQTSTTVPGLTAWHYMLGLIPLAASILAVLGGIRQATFRLIDAWLVIALTLLAGAQLHAVFWPSMYSSILTTTSILRAGVALIVVVGGILQLRHIILQRNALLVAEQDRLHRLEELTQLKSDFTAIVAHELASPVAAISVMAQMLTVDDLPTETRQSLANDIHTEARLLQMLVLDVRESASIERDELKLNLRALPVDDLVSEAAAYARSLPGSHPVKVDHSAHASVLADPGRIGQVVRNLLNNAARHTPDGTPITICTWLRDGEIEIAVIDEGPGIAPEDLDRIFEKYGRGRDAAMRHAGGRGLGLYLSRRILQAHQSDLAVESTPDRGTTFRFALKELS